MTIPTPPTPEEQQAHNAELIAAFVKSLREEVIPVYEGLRDQGITDAQLLFFGVMQVRELLIRMVPSAHNHPTVVEGCELCAAQERRRAAELAYIERATKYMDEESHGDDWKPL